MNIMIKFILDIIYSLYSKNQHFKNDILTVIAKHKYIITTYGSPFYPKEETIKHSANRRR